MRFRPRLLAGFLAALLALASVAALAQEPPPSPMEMQQKTIAALQAMLDLREAQLKTVAATAKNQEEKLLGWAEYAKPLWQAKK